MALNVNRWMNYAKARIDSAIGSGHESLDRLEAKQEADRADKPWLASDSTAPTFDEARARIAWEADQQAKKADRHQQAEDGDETGSGARGSIVSTSEADTKETGAKAGTKAERAKTGGSGAETGGAAGSGNETSGDPAVSHRRETDRDPAPTDLEVDSGPAPRSPQQIAEDAELETARLELEDRQRKSAERLDQIRQELGLDDPPAP